MNKAPLALLVLGATLVAAITLGIAGGRMPMGVPGEWTWNRIPAPVNPITVAKGFFALVAYAALVWIGWKGMTARRWRKAWLAGLAFGAFALQLSLIHAAPAGYDLARWSFALYSSGSSGYYTVAKAKVAADPADFLANYPTWIRGQDSLHVGTHPPGLFLTSYAALRLMEWSPALTDLTLNRIPRSLERGFRELDTPRTPLPRSDRASMALTGLLTVMACSATVLPLYALARISLEPRAAWASASLWPVIPSTILFNPGADTAFPLLATLALALAAWSAERLGKIEVAMAIGSGVLLGIGTLFTLAFFPVGLIVALLILSAKIPLRDRLKRIAAVGSGFLGLIFGFWLVARSNPFVTWWWNQVNHARFYVEFPRTYWIWILVNIAELAIGLGLPAAVWVCAGMGPRGQVPRAAWAGAAVLLFLNLSGKNLSEVPRLWIMFMPTLLIAAGWGLGRLNAGPKILAATVVLVGIQTLILSNLIQVIYPI